ncbi:MAG: DUF3604 domain-containing protein [Pseudomonadota bacterium]
MRDKRMKQGFAHFACIAALLTSACGQEGTAQTPAQNAVSGQPGSKEAGDERSADTQVRGATEPEAGGTRPVTDATARRTNRQTSRKNREQYSPYAGDQIPRTVFFGDTHLHTSYSFDAGMVGDTLDPDAAYRFAKGEEVTASLGTRARLSRPLDFLVIADHAESLGIAAMIAADDPRILADRQGKEIYDAAKSDDPVAGYLKFSTLRAETGKPPMHRSNVRRSMWDRIVAIADEHNDPGAFTAFIGYEFTSALKTNNLHRVVVFRDGADKAGAVLPYSSVESLDPEDLWRFMSFYETSVGGQVMAIPHNGNLSNGMMFDDKTFYGKPLDAEYAAQRARWEPLYEVTQIKGDGEAHPILSPNDEFADFWNWDKGNFGFAAKTPDMLPREYARAALKRGLAYEDEFGVNPFKFGLIGSTDSHTSLATAAEDNFYSKAAVTEPGAGQNRYDQAIIQKYPGRDVDVRIYSYETAAAGLAAVWATENTREAIFDAMARKEVYATTGTRISLRVFAGFDFTDADAASPRLAEVGYEKGVPMGGDISAGGDRAPRLMIEALRDPDGANLDRAQIVKGWLDADGALQEKIYDVVWSGERAIGADGKLAALTSTVDGAAYDNSIGAPALTTVWEDPDFDPALRAFYYVRVLEIPTPTWLAYDKAYYGDKITLPPDAVLSHQERAYSSPIWYTPEG